MFGSWKLKLGSLFGIGIYVHWTFLLLPLWAIFFSGAGDNPFGVGFYLALLVGVFGCVVLHELGHALTARRFGIGTRDITLYPIGGVARLEKMSEKPSEEFWNAVAGPAVNVVIAGLLTVVGIARWLYFGPVSFEELQSNPVGLYLVLLWGINLILVGFNMLPAFPMDGGRVFRALLSMWLGHLQATRIAVYVGTVVIILVAGALFLIPTLLGGSPSPMIIILAAFVLLAGQQELRMVEMRNRWGEWDGIPEVLPVRRRRYYEESDVVEMVPTSPHSYEPYQPKPAAGYDSASGLVLQPKIAVYTWDSQTGAWVREPGPKSAPPS